MKKYVIILIVIAILIIGYFIFPKYQIVSNSGTIYRLNKITGEITHIGQYSPSGKLLKPTKLLRN